jgi:hypothetical protein
LDGGIQLLPFLGSPRQASNCFAANAAAFVTAGRIQIFAKREAMAQPTPIMTRDQERFMAFEGLVQWTQAIVTQSAKVSAARDRLDEAMRDPAKRRAATLAFHSECHFFAIAAFKLIEFRKWVATFGLCATVDFSEIDKFSEQDIRDLRNMREHVVDYFTGAGNTPTRWNFETPEYKADASSVVGTMIGGRLDWVKFGAAAERLLPKLLAEPIPYPPGL